MLVFPTGYEGLVESSETGSFRNVKRGVWGVCIGMDAEQMNRAINYDKSYILVRGCVAI